MNNERNHAIIEVRATGYLNDNRKELINDCKELFGGRSKHIKYPDNCDSIVNFERACFWLGGHFLGHLCRDGLEVIGNIHENPELLIDENDEE